MEGEVVAKELGLVETAMTLESVVKKETKEESKDLKPSSRTWRLMKFQAPLRTSRGEHSVEQIGGARTCEKLHSQ